MTLRNPSTKVTILDVARLAGVSKSTASKALNNQNYVSEATRQRVLDAAQKLNFSPNKVAQSLKQKRSYAIGLITDDLEGLFTTSMLHGVDEAIISHNFNVILCNSFGDAAREKARLEMLLARQIDGVILLGYKVRERGLPALVLGDVPVVYLYQYTVLPGVPSVIPDDFGGAIMGTQHLLELGRRRIAFVNGPPHYEVTHLRREGYRHALETAGKPYDPNLVFTSRKWHQNFGYDAGKQLRELAELPDAVFCASDSLAIGVMDALHESGHRVPDDIAVVGFDNRPYSAHQRRPLTTVALPLKAMGVLAGELLIDAIMNETHESVVHRVPCYLVRRESSGT